MNFDRTRRFISMPIEIPVEAVRPDSVPPTTFPEIRHEILSANRVVAFDDFAIQASRFPDERRSRLLVEAYFVLEESLYSKSDKLVSVKRESTIDVPKDTVDYLKVFLTFCLDKYNIHWSWLRNKLKPEMRSVATSVVTNYERHYYGIIPVERRKDV